MYNKNSMWNKIKKLFHSTAFNIFLIFALAFLVLFVSMKDDYVDVINTLKKVKIGWLAFMLGLMVLERYMLGWGLAAEVRLTHPKYTNKQGFVNAYTAGLFNNITPGASGGQIAQGYIFRKQGIPVSNSVGVLWLDFIVYQMTMCAFVFFLLLIRFNYFYQNYSQFFLIVILGFLVAVGIIGFLWALALSPRFYTWLTTKGIKIGAKLHIVRNEKETLRNLDTQLEQFAKEIVVLKTHKKLIALLSIEDLGRLFIYYAVPFFCALALGLDVKPSMFIDMTALASFVAMVNAFLPMPGSSGGTEATFILMFSTLFSQSDATSIMILWRLLTFYQVLIIGSCVFFYARTRKDIPVEETHVPTTYNPSALKEAMDKEEKQ